MGCVYRAEHVAIRRPVAIKVLHPGLSEDPAYGKRFQREALVTGRADHPNCVTVSDFGSLEGGGYYLVMELVEGVVLGDLLITVGRLPVDRALHIARHVLRGLAHAHAAGVVHRDVKPNNIILVRQGDDPDFAKLLDFGIAKLVGEAADAGEATDHQITRVGTTVGTPSYVAPEQALGGGVDPRADLYSLSIVLYEMIAGRPPFRADDTVKLLTMHLSAPVPPIAEVAPGVEVPAAVEEVIRVGLAKEPANRHASASTYLAAVDALIAGPADAAAAPAGGSMAAAGRRAGTRRLAAVAALLALVIGGAVVAGLRLAGRGAQEQESLVEDARAELALGHERMAGGRTLEAVEAYRRALALHPGVAAGDRALVDDAESLLRARDGSVALAAVELVGDMEGDWARDKLAELAGTDRRNAVRQRARALAEKRGAGGRIDRLSSYSLDLLHGRTCEERARAVPLLRGLGDKRAIPALERARTRKTGGILGIGARSVNGCMRAELDEAIARLRQL